MLSHKPHRSITTQPSITMEVPQEDEQSVILPSSLNLVNSKPPCHRCGINATLHEYSDQCLLEEPLLQGYHGKRLLATMQERRQIAGLPYGKVLRMAAAEMVAVFLIMFSACGTAIANKRSHGDLTLLGFATAGGLAVMIMVFAVGHISGAHLNPAITLAFASKKMFPLNLVPIYVFAQFLGAVVAAGVLQALTHDAEASLTLPHAGDTEAFIVELIIGFNLMFVATAVSTSGNNSGELAGIAVGATVVLNVLLAGPTSGASMNPVRTLGPAIVANKYDSIWIYLIAPPVGALAGAWTHTLLQISA